MFRPFEKTPLVYRFYYPAKVKIVVSHGGTGARGSGFLRAPVPLCEKNIGKKLTK